MPDSSRQNVQINPENKAAIREMVRKKEAHTQTEAINTLLRRGAELPAQLERQQRLLELAVFRVLHTLRCMVDSREGDVLEKIDAEFPKQLAEMEWLVLEQGMSHVD